MAVILTIVIFIDHFVSCYHDTPVRMQNTAKASGNDKYVMKSRNADIYIFRKYTLKAPVAMEAPETYQGFCISVAQLKLLWLSLQAKYVKR